jgi:hypothetical protein
VRLRRTVVQERFVSVPVTDAVMADERDADGTTHLDPEKLWAVAVELGSDDADWVTEESTVEPHPIQKPPPGIDPAADPAP